MASVATLQALAERAGRAAKLMEIWSNDLSQELQKQNVPMDGSGTTVILEANSVIAMVSHMVPLSLEIRQFQRNLAGQRIRARKR